MGNERILSGIPEMRYGDPSAVCFIGSVMRFMEYIGDPVEEDELIALSGVGLCFPWKYESFCDEVSIIPEIPGRTFSAFGYESEYLRGDGIADKEACLDKIRQSIDGGRPVIGFGITQKMPMTCLIAGYDESGLYTRSFWPPEGADCDSDEYFYSTDWHENCSGLLIVGEKTGERFTGAEAYQRITRFAWKYRVYEPAVTTEGQSIYINQHAYDAMVEWLLDDEQWQNPDEGNKEQYLKQCGLLLLGHYRGYLLEYLRKLDKQFPNLVNPPVFTALENILKAIPGAHESDLWLHEAVDPALSDFVAMSSRPMREKVVNYVIMLKEFDNSVQWTLFMPEFIESQTNGFKVESFEYRELPAMRFLGREGEEFSDITRRLEVMRELDALEEYKSGFDYDILFMHHYGLSADNSWHGVWGRFMKADAPVLDGFLAFDFVPHDITAGEHAAANHCSPMPPGPPYYSKFAFATFSGETEAIHSREGFDCDAMYDTTRNIILSNGVGIPYPEKYWTAEVFLDGCDKDSTGYLFSIG